MNVKNTFFLAIISALVSATMAVVYQLIYNKLYYVDFSAVMGIPAIVAACIVGGLLLAWGNYFSLRLFKKHGQVIFNVLAGILSFASIIGPMTQTLPLEVEFPEMFPGLAVPMHFFPVMAHLAFVHLFTTKSV